MKAITNGFMGLFILILSLAFTACKTEPEVNEAEETKAEEPISEVKEEIFVKPEIPLEERAFSYDGKIKGNIPVFIHFTEQDSILSGEIVYLNTKAKKPIRIIGEILPNNFYHILEFDKTGFITGIWSLTKKGDQMSGTWYASGNNDSYKMEISPSDSIVQKQELEADPSKVFGAYAYSYTKEGGNTGDFSITKKNDKESLFQILGVHSAPGYNMASIEECTVQFDGKTDEFDFLIPEEESCDFKVKFYKDFAVVRYTNGYCAMGYFGHNATVEGLFLKVK